MTPPSHGLGLSLAEPGLEGYMSKVDQALADGLRPVVIHCAGHTMDASCDQPTMEELVRALRERRPNVSCSSGSRSREVPGELHSDAIHVLLGAEDAVAELLLSFLDLPSGMVVAPRKNGVGLDSPLFLVSVPKAGTHLLLQLARVLGFADGGAHEGDVTPGAWFYVEYSNAHTAADDFFIDSVRRSPFGNRGHPALSAPILFAYRYPPDILLSEAHYYHRPGNSPFAGYLAGLSLEERLLRLADDPFLFGRFRDRLARFVPWLSFPNVIPVSFEELVGGAAGGSDEARRRLLWSLLLKLRVPGDVDGIIDNLSDRSGETFREGRVGRSLDELPATVQAALASQPQDVMAAFGYPAIEPGGTDMTGRSLLSWRREEHLRRPLVVPPAASDEQPILVETDYLGFNIIRYRGRYFGLSMAAGPLDLTTMTETALNRLLNHTHIGGLRRRLVAAMLLEDDSFLGDLRGRLELD